MILGLPGLTKTHQESPDSAAANVNSRSAELDHVDRWAQNNNLRLNRAKSAEIVFTNCKRKHAKDPPPQMPDVRRVTSIKMLGVTMTNHLSAGEHVRDVIGKCAQSLHALKLLRHHGMSDDSLRHVYKAVVLSKLLYASLVGDCMIHDIWEANLCLGLSPRAHPCTRLCGRYNKFAKCLKDFTATIGYKEGNTGSFFYTISLFGDGDGEGGRLPSPQLPVNPTL